MNDFIKYIEIGDFKNAKKYTHNMSPQELYNFIGKLGFATEKIALYTFVVFLLLDNETANLHYCASFLIAQCFVYIEGAYSMGLFHARRCVELAPEDHSYKEYLLSFYGIPDKLLSKEEAIEIATQLQHQDPGNIAAEHFFQDIKGGIPNYLKK